MKRLFTIFIMIACMLIAWSPAMATDECDGPDCLQTVDLNATAAPSYYDFGSNGYGYAETYATGVVETDVYAQGNKSAFAKARAEGTAKGDFGSIIIDTPRFKFGAVGAYSKLSLEGSGLGIGKDHRAYGPDFASVDINMSGSVFQQTGGYVGNGWNGFGGSQYSGANFSASDWDSNHSYDFHYHTWWGACRNWNNPAISADWADASALAAGGTVGFNLQTRNAAMGGALTAGASGWNANAPSSYGNVYGAGSAQFVATKVKNGSFGQVSGTAEYCYDGYSRGAGIAGVGGYTKISNTSNSSSVTAVSVGFAAASANGGDRRDD